MADEIQRTIYKLEIDDSGYIRGIDSLSASTQRFAQVQDAANKKLAEAKIALKAASDAVLRQQQELDNANKGSNTGIIKQRQDALKSAQVEQQKLTDLVKQTEIEYQKATKLATDFANSTAKGRIAIPPVTPQNIPQLPLGGTGLGEAVGASAAEFEQLRGAIAAAELALSEMNQESEEFKALAPAVEAGKKALADYDAAAESAGQSTVSLRTQIRQGREELVKLEQQGKANTKEYFELEKNVARLTDAFGDQQQRIKILASDTKALDFGKGAITAATAAFSAYTSVSVLVGDQNEELQKKTLQLFAAMQLLQSLEQLSNLTRREGVLATLAQSGAQAAYTAVVGASTGALKGFKLALAGTGIGIAIFAITALVVAYQKLGEASKEAAAEQKAVTEIGQAAASSFAAEVTHLDLIKTKLNDLTISQKQRISLAKEYNKTAEEANKIDLKQIDNIALINKAIDSQIAKIKERALARAAETVIAEKAEAVFRIQAEIDAKSPVLDVNQRAATARLQAEQQTLDARVASIVANQAKIKGIKPVSSAEILALSGLSDEQIAAGAANSDKLKLLQDKTIANELRSINLRKQQIASQNVGINADLRGLFDSLDTAQDALNNALKFGVDFITVESLFKEGGTKIENVFIQERDRLLAKIAELRRSEETGIKAINDEFAAKLTVEQNRIAQLLKEQKLTEPQAKILVQLAISANQTELNKALADFNKKVLDAREKLNDDLRKLQAQSTEDTLSLIQDEFERRKQLIDFNQQQELSEQQEFTNDRLATLDLDRLLIGEETYQRVKAGIIEVGEQNSLNILARFAAQRKDLAADIFKQSLDAIGSGLNIGLIFRDENLANEVRDASNRFLQGKIKYEAFQKELTAIQKREEGIRRDAVLSNQRSELAELDRHIALILDKTSQEFKDLTQRRNDLRTKIAQGEKEDAVKDAEDENTDPNKKKVETLNDYVVAVGQLADSVIQFWQAANEAESAALDRSISLQEKRVTAAQRIAERGNAQYLKAEEDRLKELTIKRENAARRELAINAALQASQLLVGITGAISKIATPGIGIAESIGAFAVIVSSLAAGYGLVKSLQGSQPRLAKGDPYVKRNGHPSGVDTIPAWLNEGEAVIPTETNKKYHPAIRAIYDEKIPAEDINAFVKNYHAVKGVPRVNYDRIKESAELNITTDGRMAAAISDQNKLIQENNELQRLTLRAMKSMSVSANIDRDGVSVMVNEYIQQMNLNKKI
jgi:hypothetical protein